VTVVWKIDGVRSVTNESDMKFAQCLPRVGTESHDNGLVQSNQPGSLLMRSKLAVSALVVTSLFGSTLIASAQSQPEPGASSEGNGASSEGNGGTDPTSGVKAKHEKGMTTGSSTRSGANKGGVANPSDQDSAGSGAMAAPQSGSTY
jgi:hypothetical protein